VWNLLEGFYFYEVCNFIELLGIGSLRFIGLSVVWKFNFRFHPGFEDEGGNIESRVQSVPSRY